MTLIKKIALGVWQLMILGECEVVWKQYSDGVDYIIWMESMGLNE